MLDTPTKPASAAVTRTHWRASLVSTLLTLPLFIFLFIGLTDADLFLRLSRKDNAEATGLVEHLTVIVLIPGIAAALIALIRYRARFPSRAHAVWLALWTLACIYFAGEEASWGQWYLGFRTPEAIAEINDQGETNLHNISSWLDQKPRTLVELFVVCGGLLLPVFARLRPQGRIALHPWAPWILALPMCWPAAAYFLLLRGLHTVNTPNFQRATDSELRELAVAWFLSLYLMSFLLRSRANPS